MRVLFLLLFIFISCKKKYDNPAFRIESEFFNSEGKVLFKIDEKFKNDVCESYQEERCYTYYSNPNINEVYDRMEENVRKTVHFYGFMDNKGKEVIEAIYSGVHSFSEGRAKVISNPLYGYINKKNEVVIPPKYEIVYPFKNGLARVYSKKRFGFIDKTGAEVIGFNYYYVSDFSEVGLAFVYDNSNFCGYINKSGRYVLEPIYTRCEDFTEGVAIVKKENDDEMVIDASGKELFRGKDYFFLADTFSEGLVPVRSNKNSFVGFVDKNGNIKIPFVFSGNAKSFKEGLAAVSMMTRAENENWGYINHSGKFIIKPIYNSAEDYKEGYAFVNSEFYIDKKGKEFRIPKFTSIEGFTDGLVKIQFGHNYPNFGYADKNGKLINRPNYSTVGDFSEGLALVSNDQSEIRHGYINHSGREIIPLMYFDAQPFSEGLAGVAIGNDQIFIDENGKYIFGREYQYDEEFSDGLVGFWKNGKAGYIDRNGKIVISPVWQLIEPFSDGLAIVTDKNDNRYYIDKEGKIQIHANYSSVLPFSDGLAFVQKEEIYRVIDKSGKVIVEDKWDFVTSFHEGLAFVGKDGKCGFIDKTGKEIIKFQYHCFHKGNSGYGIFSDGIALVSIQQEMESGDSEDIVVDTEYVEETKYIYIDKTGKNVFGMEFLSVSGFRNGVAKITLSEKSKEENGEINSKEVYINRNGKIIYEIKQKN